MVTITVEEAIKIAKIVCYAPQERLPMIFSVFESAEVDIEGLEALEEYQAVKNASALVDVDLFRADALERFKDYVANGKIAVPCRVFNDWCREKNANPMQVKRAFANKGYIEVFTETSKGKPKTSYTSSLRIGGKTERRVVLTKPEEAEDEKAGNQSEGGL